MLRQSTIVELTGSTPLTPECDCYVHQYGAIAPGRRERRYPSDMTDAEWAEVRAAMPVPAWLEGRGGRPEAYCHRGMVDAVRYLVDNGVKWAALPADYPWWRAVYDFFRRWRAYGYVRELYERLRRGARLRWMPRRPWARPRAVSMAASCATGASATCSPTAWACCWK